MTDRAPVLTRCYLDVALSFSGEREMTKPVILQITAATELSVSLSSPHSSIEVLTIDIEVNSEASFPSNLND